MSNEKIEHLLGFFCSKAAFRVQATVEIKIQEN